MIEYVIPDFNIDQIARSGQCFRFRREEEGRYSLIAGGNGWTSSRTAKPFAFPAQKTNLRGSGAITLI